MVSHLFLGVALLGSEWVLFLLLTISVVSIALMVERFRFYQEAQNDLQTFRNRVRSGAQAGRWDDVKKACEEREKQQNGKSPDFETELVSALLTHHEKNPAGRSPEILSEIAQDALLKTRVTWERNLSILATIGNNAPFIGLFGTVLGIIQAFHHLSQQVAQTGVKSVTAGVSEALIATGIGILVAIPAVVAFNLFQRRVRAALTEAEAMKSFLIGNLSQEKR